MLYFIYNNEVNIEINASPMGTHDRSEGLKLIFVNHVSVVAFRTGCCICACFAGDVPTKGGAEQGDGVPDAPEQHPWSGGHVHIGRAARGRHHAQPLSALRERQHLCTCVRLQTRADGLRQQSSWSISAVAFVNKTMNSKGKGGI